MAAIKKPAVLSRLGFKTGEQIVCLTSPCPSQHFVHSHCVADGPILVVIDDKWWIIVT